LTAGRQLRPQEIGASGGIGTSRDCRLRKTTRRRAGDRRRARPYRNRSRGRSDSQLERSHADAQLRQMGTIRNLWRVARDDPADLREKINRGLALESCCFRGGCLRENSTSCRRCWPKWASGKCSTKSESSRATDLVWRSGTRACRSFGSVRSASLRFRLARKSG